MAGVGGASVRISGLGGERAYQGRVGKNRFSRLSDHTIAHAEWSSPPNAGARILL